MQAQQNYSRSRAQSRAQSAAVTRRSAARSRGSPRGIFRPNSAMPRTAENTGILPKWELDALLSDEPKGQQTKSRPSSERRKRMARIKRVKSPRPVKPLTKLDRAQLDRTQEVLAMQNVVKSAESLHRRDEQLRERRKKQLYEADYEARMHQMMDEDRIAALREMNRKDALDRQKARERAVVMEEQLADKQEQRLRQLDQIEFEKEDFKRECARREREEIEKKKQKAVAAQARREELNSANEIAIKAKFKRQQQLYQDEMEMVEFQKQKAYEAEMQLQEKERLKRVHAKEAERLMLSQQRKIDGKAKEDEARMLAAYKEKEIKYRAKVRAQKEKKERAEKDLMVGRRIQIQQKAELIARQADQERHELFMQQETFDKQAHREDTEFVSRRQAAHQLGRDMKQQMADKKVRRTRERRRVLEVEHGEIEDQHREEQNRINTIRAESIAKMKKAGIPRTYWKELENPQLGHARPIMPSDRDRRPQ